MTIRLKIKNCSEMTLLCYLTNRNKCPPCIDIIVSLPFLINTQCLCLSSRTLFGASQIALLIGLKGTLVASHFGLGFLGSRMQCSHIFFEKAADTDEMSAMEASGY